MFIGLPMHTEIVVAGAFALVVIVLALWGLRFREDV
jgi:hypothetical protein